jgi:hypothetical protein
MGAQETAPAIESGGAMVPKEAGGKRCRSVAAVAIMAMTDILDEGSVDGMVSMDDVRRIAKAVLAARGPLGEHYALWEDGCDAAFTLRRIERQRTDFIGRILTRPFSDYFDDRNSGIERKHLPQFFAAVHMIVGDDPFGMLRTRANTAAERHRAEDGTVLWPDFYADADVRTIFEEVLVTMARSFRRFEPRKDWFLIIMNSSPSSISTSSNAFIPKRPEDKVLREFSEVHMVRLFQALFGSCRPDTFTPERRAAFVAKWGSEPEKIFGPLFVNLAAMAL